jgi:hypothetical protein
MISIYRGDSHSIQVSVTDNGAIKDLTGFQAKLTVRSKDELTISIEKGIADIPNPETGILVFDFLPSDTDILPAEYLFDVQITKGSDIKHTVIKDKLLITSDLTR